MLLFAVVFAATLLAGLSSAQSMQGSFMPEEAQEDEDPQARQLGLGYGGLGYGGLGYGGIGGGYGYGLGYGGLGYGGLGYGGLGGRYYDLDVMNSQGEQGSMGNSDGSMWNSNSDGAMWNSDRKRNRDGSMWNSDRKVIRIPGSAIAKVVIKMKKSEAQLGMMEKPAGESNTKINMAHNKKAQRVEVSEGNMGNTDEGNMENMESSLPEETGSQIVIKKVPHKTFEKFQQMDEFDN